MARHTCSKENFRILDKPNTIVCINCGHKWISKAKWVNELPLLVNELSTAQIEAILDNRYTINEPLKRLYIPKVKESTSTYNPSATITTIKTDDNEVQPYESTEPSTKPETIITYYPSSKKSFWKKIKSLFR